MLPLDVLLVNDPEAEVGALMIADCFDLQPDDFAEEAAQASNATILFRRRSSTPTAT